MKENDQRSVMRASTQKMTRFMLKLLLFSPLALLKM